MSDETEVKVYGKSLKDAVEVVGVSASVLRKAMDEFDTTTKLHGYNPDEKISGLPYIKIDGKVRFNEDDLLAFKNREKRSGGGQRGEGKKWLINVTPTQMAEIKELYPSIVWKDPYESNRKYQAAHKKSKAEKNVD
jgi:hypothetical protein